MVLIKTESSVGKLQSFSQHYDFSIFSSASVAILSLHIFCMKDSVLRFETLGKNLYARFDAFDELRNCYGHIDEHSRQTATKVTDALLSAYRSSKDVLKSRGFVKQKTSFLKPTMGV